MTTGKAMRLAVYRYLLYLLAVIIAFAIQTLDVNAVMPMLIIPIAMTAAINEEDELRAAGIGAVCGLFLDKAMGTLFGYSAVLLVCYCVLTVLIFNCLLRTNIIAVGILTVIFSFIYILLQFLFYYVVWKIEGREIIFRAFLFPCFILTSVSAFVTYPLIRLINRVRLREDIMIRELND